MGWVPGRAAPCAQQAEAHLAAFIQVGVEPDTPAPRSQELHRGGCAGVVGRQENVEQEAAIGIGSVCRPYDQRPAYKSPCSQ